MRVLIAEDSAIERMVLEEAVERLGHECVAAADGSAAWARYQELGADVLVSDWLMPGLEGPELCRRVRAHPGAPYTYVILLTALDGRDSTLAGMAAGADDYLTKPLDLDQLEARLVAAARVTALHQHLSGRALERERSLARRQALLGLAGRLAAEADPERLLCELLSEATILLGGTGGLVGRWDALQRQLVPVRCTLPGEGPKTDAQLAAMASSRAVREQSVVRLQSTIASPLVHQDRLLGSIAVGRNSDSVEAFPADAAELLEQLASIGAAALVGLDRARIDGALLAWQTLRDLSWRPERGWPNLPPQATPLIGREHELDTLRQQLLRGDVGVVTLTGPAGVGKTRLAIAAAAALVEAFEQRVIFVDLQPLAEAGQVLPTIAQTLGAPGIEPARAGDWLRQRLAELPFLLVLDNAEHLLEAASELADLVRECPAVRLLVTSREALHVQAEHQVPVPPLALADLSGELNLATLARSPAIVLFVQRARAADPSFTLTEDNARLVADICARLDGLPLAIELAAARTRVLPPMSLPGRLDQQPLAVLSGGPRDQPVRHQTLRSAIAWSYTLLSAQERRLFRQLGVFSGGFTLAAAAAVDGMRDDQAPDRVGALVAKSLVGRLEGSPAGDGQEPRFHLLQTIRQYALEQLEAEGEADAARDRHAAFCLMLAEQAERGQQRGVEQAGWLDRLEREHDNLRSAIRWLAGRGQTDAELRLVSALGWYWDARGHAAEGREALEAALKRAGTAAAAARVAALATAAALASSHGDWVAARAAYEERLALGGCDATSLAGLALAHGRLRSGTSGERNPARSLADEALRLAEDAGDRRGAGLALRVLGELATERGAFVQAQSAHESSLAIWQALDDRLQLAQTLEACAMLAAARTQAERALQLAAAAATLRAAVGAAPGRANAAVLARWLQVARQALGPERSAVVEAEGSALTPEQAVELVHAPGEPELGAMPRTGSVLEPLSERESQVAELVARGWSNRQIAAELYLSERTVEAHLRRILNRLGFASRTPLAAWVAQHRAAR